MNKNKAFYYPKSMCSVRVYIIWKDFQNSKMEKLRSSLALFLGHFAGFSYSMYHGCSWEWRPCDVNPPPKPRKVPCLHVPNENNKGLSVAAASGVQRTHQNMYKSHSLLLPPTHLSMHDFSFLHPQFSLLTHDRHVQLFIHRWDTKHQKGRHNPSRWIRCDKWHNCKRKI